MKKALATTLVALLLASCGGGVEPPKQSEERPPGAAPPIDLPAPKNVVPAFLAFSETSIQSNSVKQLEQIKGVGVVASAAIKQIPVEGPAGTADLRVAAIDPLVFRSVAPPSTRDAAFVWTELAAGEAVVTFAGADTLDLGEGDRITVGGNSLAVGAFADNGVPNIADVMVNEEIGKNLGMGQPRWLVIGANPNADLSALGTALQRGLPEARIAGLLPDPPDLLAADDPKQVGEATGSLIGTMTFRILDDGFIKPDKEWVDQNIATATVPIIGEVTCHRLLIPQLWAALNEISVEGLADLIRPGDYGGCYVPRFIDRDPSLPLSMHAFGLAADINVSTNLLGSRGDQDPRVVAIFEKWGFEWGGRWSRPDPMHFELASIVET